MSPTKRKVAHAPSNRAPRSGARSESPRPESGLARAEVTRPGAVVAPDEGDAVARALPNQLARSAILAAASRVFAREGISATRVEDILLEAGVARRTFYKYFASKEEVLATLHEMWTGELLEAIEMAQAQQPDEPLAGIRAGIDIFLGFHSAGPRALRELMELAMRSDSLLAERRAWFRGEVVRILDAAIFALDGRRLDSYVHYGLLSALEGIALELGSQHGTEADVLRARLAIHAIVDQTLGVAKPSPLPMSRDSG
jgi:AcrR family transcriptional regulator